MLFYKIVLPVPDQTLVENPADSHLRRRQARQIAQKTEEFNRCQKNSAYWFISDVLSDEVVAGMIDPSLESKPKHLKK